MGESYDQKDAAGFIRILGLPSRSRALSRGEKQKLLTAEGAETAPRSQRKEKEHDKEKAEVVR
jgi:hypothetical protein